MPDDAPTAPKRRFHASKNSVMLLWFVLTAAALLFGRWISALRRNLW